MNQSGTSARVKKKLSFCKFICYLQAVLLMTLCYALKHISSSVARRRLDAPIFYSMLCSNGIDCMRTECLRGGKLCEKHAACE